MKKITFKNPLTVNENDTLGTAVLKGLAVGYIKGTIASGIAIGTLVILGSCIPKKKDSKEEVEDERHYEDYKDYEDILKASYKDGE